MKADVVYLVMSLLYNCVFFLFLLLLFIPLALEFLLCWGGIILIFSFSAIFSLQWQPGMILENKDWFIEHWLLFERNNLVQSYNTLITYHLISKWNLNVLHTAPFKAQKYFTINTVLNYGHFYYIDNVSQLCALKVKHIWLGSLHNLFQSSEAFIILQIPRSHG